jgi:hypothetical protein
MTQQRPEYFRPALIAGAVAGVLSGLPFVSIGNCFCCLWIVGGGALAANLLAKTTGGVLTSGDGAIVGALTGITAAVVDSLIGLLLRPFNMELAKGIIDRISNLGYDMPENWESLLSGPSGMTSPALFFIGLFISAAVFTVIGILGGIIGVSLFAKKLPKASPPATPPTAPQGSGDAA